jgi:hypothetical protein
MSGLGQKQFRSKKLDVRFTPKSGRCSAASIAGSNTVTLQLVVCQGSGAPLIFHLLQEISSDPSASMLREESRQALSANFAFS